MRSRLAAITSLRYARTFGNAPNRVRPVEVSNGCDVWQCSREISGFVAIAVMFAVPMWLLVLWGSQRGRQRDEVWQWALRLTEERRGQ
uniref:Uncharacterized protein n=1 Tax=Trypanosoma vivax (strain Y486) TaxID=1055687 RepID=G0U0F9_TRYVY|nr:conserved hypothetical protein [Trypanosoma vivax Y486]